MVCTAQSQLVSQMLERPSRAELKQQRGGNSGSMGAPLQGAVSETLLWCSVSHRKDAQAQEPKGQSRRSISATGPLRNAGLPVLATLGSTELKVRSPKSPTGPAGHFGLLMSRVQQMRSHRLSRVIGSIDPEVGQLSSHRGQEGNL